MPFSSLELSYTCLFFLMEQNRSSNREEKGKGYLEVISGSFIEDP